MKNNLKKLSNNQIRAAVELDQEDLKKYINKAESVLGGNLEIKGFRKGKAPKELFKKHLDSGRVKALALEIAVQDSLSDIIKDSSLDVLDTSQLSIEKNDSAQLKYSVLLDLFPEVVLADISKVKVKRQDVKVEEKEVEDALEVIKNSRSNFINKDDGEIAEEGDRVEIDFEARKNDQIIEGGISKNHPLIIGGRSFISGFEDKLTGMKKGEEKSFSLTAPADYFYKEVAGKELTFKVKMNDIKEVVRPEANDDFARSLGRFASLRELKESVKEGLTQEKKTKDNQKLRLEILDNIISHSTIEVPDNLLNKQLGIMISDFDHTLHEKGLELGLYLAKIGKTQEELKEGWTKDAEKQVKTSLILRKLAKDLDIKATREEIEETAGQVIQSAIAKGEINQADIAPEKIKETIASRIVNEKALEYLESHCAV
ncbi:MAG: trigger factor [Candidatus Yanofskybacteria bacterium RIFCSPHIGHO2_02_FULL_43_22]|uniref:Trigger factor n=1 Tax=Candidatus Yanofskybacteria bacterium RIFCSPHIGHO2_02_FULL_43_22 TaxID=1802681 RepID=A0A1F8FU57_9BACT|nr:MAG: trigger factor [Candidatus Yanofskybacteria bacterium RIFCSPHIGHO2_02_FULL_43_22]